RLAGFDMLIAVPLGLGLALGLTRWRGYGARPVNYLMLFPLVTPEIVMAISLLLVFSLLYGIALGTEAQTLGQVTFSISYVVISDAAAGATPPALNAVATVMVAATLLAVGLAYLVYHWASRAQPAAAGSALNEIAALDM